MNGDDDLYRTAVLNQLRPGQPAPPSLRQRFLDEMMKLQQAQQQRPDMTQREEVARQQHQAAGESVAPAMLLQALGGRLAPAGGQILRQAMAAREPQKVTGGEIIGGQFVEDPYAAHERRLKGQEFGVRTAESAATHEETAADRALALAERERANRQAATDRAAAERRHTEQIAESRAGRQAGQTLARERFEYEKGRDKYTLVKDAEGHPIGTFNPATGKVEPLQGGGGMMVAGGQQPTTGDQRVAKRTEGGMAAEGYLGRMKRAESIMERPELEQGQKPGLIEQAVGRKSDVLANLTRSTERQQVRQAQEDWVRAKLRKESGAVIADEEMEREIRVYFPQINDGPEVIAQKREAREEALNQMRTMAGFAPQLPAGSMPDVPRGTPVGSVPEVSREPTKTLPPSKTAPGGAGWRIVR